MFSLSIEFVKLRLHDTICLTDSFVFLQGSLCEFKSDEIWLDQF